MLIKGYRKAVENVNPYVPGKTIKEVQKLYGLDNIIKLGSNENPYGPFTNAQKAMIDEVRQVFMYPDNTYEELKQLLAQNFGVTAGHIAISHGAGGMLETLAKTFIEQGDEVIIPRQTYGLYREISRAMGGRVVEIPLDQNYRINLQDIKSAITEKTKLIWLCNPNNPTGTVVDKDAFSELVDGLREDIWLILDEAYAEFAEKQNLPDAVTKVLEEKNIVIVRTMSKAYGLAGIRIGYAVAHPDMIRLIDTVAEPFNANRVGLAGAIATLLYDTQEYNTALSTIIRDREILIREIRGMGLECLDSHTNFVFVKTPYKADDLAAQLLKMGVIIRSCSGWDYPEFLRITVGSTKENEIFLKAFKDVIKNNGNAGKGVQ